jgi:hypothetical protein
MRLLSGISNILWKDFGGVKDVEKVHQSNLLRPLCLRPEDPSIVSSWQMQMLSVTRVYREEHCSMVYPTDLVRK